MLLDWIGTEVAIMWVWVWGGVVNASRLDRN